MKPDLKRHNIEDYYIVSNIIIPEQLITRIKGLSPPDDDGDCDFWESYRINNASHRGCAWISQEPISKDLYKVSISYDVAKGGRLKKNVPRIEQLIDILSSTKESAWACRISFKFSRRKKVRSIIPLPMKIIDLPDSPFDYISGVHAVKKKGETHAYDVVLDNDRSGRLIVNVVFPYEDKLQRDLVEKVIKRGIDISEKMVLRK